MPECIWHNFHSFPSKLEPIVQEQIWKKKIRKHLNSHETGLISVLLMVEGKYSGMITIELIHWVSFGFYFFVLLSSLLFWIHESFHGIIVGVIVCVCVCVRVCVTIFSTCFLTLHKSKNEFQECIITSLFIDFKANSC